MFQTPITTDILLSDLVSLLEENVCIYQWYLWGLFWSQKECWYYYYYSTSLYSSGINYSGEWIYILVAVQLSEIIIVTYHMYEIILIWNTIVSGYELWYCHPTLFYIRLALNLGTYIDSLNSLELLVFYSTSLPHHYLISYQHYIGAFCFNKWRALLKLTQVISLVTRDANLHIYMRVPHDYIQASRSGLKWLLSHSPRLIDVVRPETPCF